MLLGISDNLQEQSRILIKKRIGAVTIVFLCSAFLPIVIYSLFYFNVMPSKPAFSKDIQEPVTKILLKSGGVGTAFLINSTTLLTARHVVEDLKIGDQVDIIFEHSKNKFQTKATVKFISPSSIHSSNGMVPAEYFLTDIAVLEVSAITDIEPLVLGESDAVQNLDEVILIGYPNGDYSISKGNINSDKYQGLNLFKLDATSNPGNSGGPLLDSQGNIIGVIRGKISSAEGTGFAIKSTEIMRSIAAIEGDSAKSELLLNNSKSALKKLKRSEQIKRINPYVFNVLVYKNN